MEKMTYVKALEIAISAVADNKEVAEKLMALQTSIAKKNSAERKPTAQQVANGNFKADILAFLQADGGMHTITEMMKAVPSIAELSNQRVSAIVRQMKDEGSVERIEDKRKAYFKAIVE